MRIGNFELKSCDSHLSTICDEKDKRQAKIVYWINDHVCYNLCYFDASEDINLHSIGDRILMIIDHPEVHELLTEGFRIVEELNPWRKYDDTAVFR